MQKMMILGASIALIGLAACNKADLSSPKGKASYAIGTQIGKTMKAQGIEVDVPTLAAALADTLAGKEPKLTDAEMREAIMALQASRGASKDPAAAAAKPAAKKK